MEVEVDPDGRPHSPVPALGGRRRGFLGPDTARRNRRHNSRPGGLAPASRLGRARSGLAPGEGAGGGTRGRSPTWAARRRAGRTCPTCGGGGPLPSPAVLTGAPPSTKGSRGRNRGAGDPPEAGPPPASRLGPRTARGFRPGPRRSGARAQAHLGGRATGAARGPPAAGPSGRGGGAGAAEPAGRPGARPWLRQEVRGRGRRRARPMAASRSGWAQAARGRGLRGAGPAPGAGPARVRACVGSSRTPRPAHILDLGTRSRPRRATQESSIATCFLGVDRRPRRRDTAWTRQARSRAWGT